MIEQSKLNWFKKKLSSLKKTKIVSYVYVDQRKLLKKLKNRVKSIKNNNKKKIKINLIGKKINWKK